MSVVGTVRTPDPLTFINQNTYIKEDNTAGIQVYVQGVKSVTAETDGGILHGAWTSDAAIVTSDRRLKKEIVPLQRTLKSFMQLQDGKAQPRNMVDSRKPGPSARAGLTDPSGATGSGDGALWLLRQLRPVSYSFRKGSESKYMRFGFIADELESVVPQVVRNVGDKEVSDQKAVVYQDLIALLAASLQAMQGNFENIRDTITQMKKQKQVEALVKAERRKNKTNATRRGKGRTLRKWRRIPDNYTDYEDRKEIRVRRVLKRRLLQRV